MQDSWPKIVAVNTSAIGTMGSCCLIFDNQFLRIDAAFIGSRTRGSHALPLAARWSMIEIPDSAAQLVLQFSRLLFAKRKLFERKKLARGLLRILQHF